MTRDTFKRALEIENELSQLRPAQREIEKNPTFNIYFSTTLCIHKGLQEVIKKYVYNRINELNKEFYDL